MKPDPFFLPATLRDASVAGDGDRRSGRRAVVVEDGDCGAAGRSQIRAAGIAQSDVESFGRLLVAVIDRRNPKRLRGLRGAEPEVIAGPVIIIPLRCTSIAGRIVN